MSDNFLDISMELPGEAVTEGPSSKTQYSLHMDAKTILTLCQSEDIHGEIGNSLIRDGASPSFHHQPPSKKLRNEELYPPIPSVHLFNEDQALGAEFMRFCCKQPVVVARKFTLAVDFNSELFSTKTLVNTDPDQIVDVEIQMLQSSDKNRHPKTGEKVWIYLSHSSNGTIKKCAEYQTPNFPQKFLEERSEAFSRMSDSEEGPPKDFIDNQTMLQFGTDINLSDENKWGAQLQELMKLPTFARVESTVNMLSYVGHLISGVNAVQLSMNVPGGRFPALQENNNFCSVNINVGPGDCEWFAVPEPYWGAVRELCEKNEVNYVHDFWWPDLKELYNANIPVYRFFQRAGDMVWINSGCIYWVQSTGFCNNIAWNVGPLRGDQYQLAIERYEWNKLQNFKSIVPMANLSWNLARTISTMDLKLFYLIKRSLMRTLRQCMLTLEFIKDKDIELAYCESEEDESTFYCKQCKIEIFNMVFVRHINEDKKVVGNCLECARKQSPDLKDFFLCLQTFEIEDLMQVYDNFQLEPLFS